MIHIEEHFFKTFIETAHAVGGKYSLCSSGNLSLRVNDSICLISKTGSWMQNITKQEISICNYKTEEILNGLKPSSEYKFHFGIFCERADVNAIIHSQPMYATTIACSKKRPSDYNITAEIPCYIGNVVEIPYTRPGSAELAKKVINALKDNQLALLLNHGIVTVGNTADEAFQRTCFFEMACRIIIQNAYDYNVLSKQDVKDIDKYILGKTN